MITRVLKPLASQFLHDEPGIRSEEPWARPLFNGGHSYYAVSNGIQSVETWSAMKAAGNPVDDY